MAVGSGHSLGLKSDGSIAAWGYNALGQCNVTMPNTDYILTRGGHITQPGPQGGWVSYGLGIQ
ncbi:MAG: hypothetical protein H6678_08330 [Candidatus Delongbacteria bacterium]|nr:hypothetical protein [Candidatus Delongbacteria bacterium]